MLTVEQERAWLRWQGAAYSLQASAWGTVAAIRAGQGDLVLSECALGGVLLIATMPSGFEVPTVEVHAPSIGGQGVQRVYRGYVMIDGDESEPVAHDEMHGEAGVVLADVLRRGWLRARDLDRRAGLEVEPIDGPTSLPPTMAEVIA